MVFSKIYTKRGDSGKTKLCNGQEIEKNNQVIIALSKIDSLQSALDLALLTNNDENLSFLNAIQKKLSHLAGEIAECPPNLISESPSSQDLKELENFIDSFGQIPPGFVRFKTQKSIQWNECRIRCRDLEISLVSLLQNKKIRPEAYAYINRLSSLFFVLALKNQTIPN